MKITTCLGVLFAIVLLAGCAQGTVTPTASPAVLPLEAPTGTPMTGDVPDEIVGAHGAVMRFVAAGEFIMGGADGDASPLHTVYLDAYYMDKFEVTNAAYRECVAAGACQPPDSADSFTRPGYYADPLYDNFPVTHVTWFQAVAYCQWRDARLPTEAEWEKAARGTDGRSQPWGDGSDCDHANYLGREGGCVGDTTEVGIYQTGVSPYGIHDMVGNVWEWVADWFDAGYYAASPFVNPLGPSSGDGRVQRGGAWNHNERFANPIFRAGIDPSEESFSVGFRCSRAP